MLMMLSLVREYNSYGPSPGTSECSGSQPLSDDSAVRKQPTMHPDYRSLCSLTYKSISVCLDSMYCVQIQRGVLYNSQHSSIPPVRLSFMSQSSCSLFKSLQGFKYKHSC
ncbi:hypothetical protein AMECASPLE_030576 [Ameca splendens]|uniref:Uncharacterized protein n=1 Tax=Ameca splendens TaxID=208324 RepID=A0ABV1AD16_9TELE